MKTKTAMQELIEKLIIDSKYLNGEDDCKEDKIVGQYLMSIANDLKENYLQKERQQIIDAHISGQKFASNNDNPDSNEYFTQKYEQ